MVIGYNSFKVKTLKVKDLLTSGNADHLSHVDVIGRRMYFHLMFIPLFPMWGVWMIRVNDKEVLAPVEVLSKLQEKNIKVGTPWYTFLGPILAAIIGLCYWWSITRPTSYEVAVAEGDPIENIRWEMYAPVLEKADTADYYLLQCYDGNKDKIARVVSSNATEITYALFKAPEEIREPKDLYPWGSTVYTPDTIVVKRTDLILLKQTAHDGFVQGSLMLNGSNYPYHLEVIFRVSQPWITGGNSVGDCEYGDYCIDFYNFGIPITIKKIETISGEVDWEGCSTTDPIAADERFSLYGDKSGISHDQEFDLRIICVDSNQREYKFRIAGIGYDNFIVPE